MKDSKGISVLALVITVIVILMITAITAYTGINLISDARKKDATDKLKVICNSLRKDDSFINAESLDNVLLTEQDYASLDLKGYYDKDYPVYITKTITTTAVEVLKSYTLNMYRGNNRSEVFATVSFDIPNILEKHIYTAQFDDKKGVNRPLVMDNMIALSNDGTTPVEDVYTESWYNYNSSSPSFAKMQYDRNGDGVISSDEDMIYVWIPRFAYSIQTYYDGSLDPERIHLSVPSTAIKIVFLKEDTKYMHNEEVVPSNYKIHPAFQENDQELAGFWIAMSPSTSTASFSSAMSTTKTIANNSTQFSSHLMTNSEYGAVLYLLFAYDAFNEVDLESKNEFVAAVLEGAAESSNDYIDVYKKDSESVTGLAEKFGDAMLETNWDRITATYINATNQCIVRLLKSNYFDFSAVNKTSNYYYRAVIVSDL